MNEKTIPAILSVSPNRVWRTYPGGKTLDALDGNPTPADSHFAEEWIVSTTRAVNKGREEIEEGYSKVNIKGQSFLLKDLVQEHPLEFLGKAHYKKYGANTQFLLKFLDSAIRLHIQAHPTIAFSQQHLNSNSGKTEAYVILGTREEVSDPYIYLGFQHPLSKEKFKQAVADQDMEKILSCFKKIPIRPGDVFFVPGGLPHAIGEGVFMIEIMEPTDFVVRLEFEKAGYVLPEEARFMGRGIDFAMDMIEFKPLGVDEIKEKYFCKPVLVHSEKNYQEFILVGPAQTNCFSVRKMIITGSYTRSSDSFHAGIVTKGEGTIEAGGEQIQVKKGDRFLVPYATKEVSYQGTELEIVVTFPPGVKEGEHREHG